jgi:hypothetical protein
MRRRRVAHLGDADDLGHHAHAVAKQLDLDDHGRDPARDHVEPIHERQHVGRQVLQLGVVPRLLQQLLVLFVVTVVARGNHKTKS